MIIIIIPVISLLLRQTASQSYETCLTPNGSQGFCQPVKSCASILKMLEQNLTPQVRQFLQKSQCVAGQPWVCCPDQVSASVTPVRAPVRASPTITSKLPKAPACGIESSDRIYGGETTRIDEYPWLVQIQYTKPGGKKGFNCGGSLINQRYVITAAHCVLKVPTSWKLTGVRLGEWDTSTVRDCDDSFINEHVCNNPPVDISVEEKIVHENYEPKSRDQHNDIALLRLSKDVQYTNFIKPICLPVDDSIKTKDLNGVTLDVAGWGKTETSSTSTRKLKVAINAYSNSDCKGVYGPLSIVITDTQICAGGDPGRDSCNGDSGGPLMRHHEKGATPHIYLAGIVSYGPKNCGTPHIPGVYTRTAKYIDWIESKIRD